MEIESAFYAEAIGTAGIAALISTRLYPGVMQADATLPAAAYQTVSRTAINDHDGDAELYTSAIQVTITAATYAAAKAIAAAFRALHGFQGKMGGVSGVQVYECWIESEYDGYNQQQGDQTVRLDFSIMHG